MYHRNFCIVSSNVARLNDRTMYLCAIMWFNITGLHLHNSSFHKYIFFWNCSPLRWDKGDVYRELSSKNFCLQQRPIPESCDGSHKPMECRLLTPGLEYYDSDSSVQSKIVYSANSETVDHFIKSALRLRYSDAIQFNFHIRFISTSVPFIDE